MNFKEMNPAEIVDFIRNGEITSEVFETFEDYMKWLHGIDELREENKRLKEIVERLEKAIETKKQKVLSMHDRTNFHLINTLDYQEGILKELKEILSTEEGKSQ